MVPERLKYNNGTLEILNQKKLPASIEYVKAGSAFEVAGAIRDMVLRGAPLIGCAAAYGFALEIKKLRPAGPDQLKKAALATAGTLKNARPTALALFYAADRMLDKAMAFAAAGTDNFSEEQTDRIIDSLEKEARKITEEDISSCDIMGELGSSLLPENSVVMTHCNAGALATMGIGTAVGMITAAHKKGLINHAYSCETRPYLQGARLTIWELMREKVPAELITDNMAAHIMRTCGVNAVIVGADRIASNGDTANKIGTYGLAIIAKYHKIPFYVVAPTPTVDLKIRFGKDIKIEERPAEEVSYIKGIRITPEGVKVRHPAFDVTPAGLITALVTEKGIVSPVNAENIRKLIK